VLGVLSALPLVQIGNFCCCLWVICGGVVAAGFLQQSQSSPITTGEGAFVGFLAGILGTVIYVALSVPINALTAPYVHAVGERLLDSADFSPQFRAQFRAFLENSDNPGTVLRIVASIAELFVITIFSTLGGLLGAVIFRKKAPPAVIDVPPA